MARFTPDDLPTDFKLTWHHFPDASTVTLDANGMIERIANKFTGVPAMAAGTASITGRQKPEVVNGFTTASGVKGSKGIIMLGDVNTFPRDNADRYMLIVVMNNGEGGVIAGYKHDNGGGNWWFDSDFYLSASRGNLNAGGVPSKVLHTFVARHKDGISTLRVDGVQKARGAVTIAGANGFNQQIGIRGARDDFFTMGGCTLMCIYGKRDATDDENFLLEAYAAQFTGQPIPADNPYRNGLPDMGGPATPARKAPRSFRFL